MALLFASNELLVPYHYLIDAPPVPASILSKIDCGELPKLNPKTLSALRKIKDDFELKGSTSLNTHRSVWDNIYILSSDYNISFDWDELGFLRIKDITFKEFRLVVEYSDYLEDKRK